MAHRKVVDRDRGWKKYKERARGVSKERPGVTVGVHAGEGAALHSMKDKHRPEGLTVLEVAYINEFGLGVPERSFIRAWFDASEPENLRLAMRMLRGILSGTIALEDALAQMGAKFAGEVQRRIAQGIPPPNAPATIAAKGSSTPLVASGQMRQSVTWKVARG
jgi:hypothetical protein